MLKKLCPKHTEGVAFIFVENWQQEYGSMSDFISNDSLKIRVNVDLQVILKRAAELQGLTVESFVVAAIHDAAQRAIE